MYNGLTFLRAIAAFFIVGCHLQLIPRTWAGELITSFCNMNVGLFGAISGFLLANSIHKSRDEFEPWCYIKKRFFRLIPAYAAWSAFYILASAIFAMALNGEMECNKYVSLKFWYKVVLWGGSSCHLWFIASLFYIQFIVVYCKPLRDNLYMCFFSSMALVFLSTLSRNFYYLYPSRLFGFVLLGLVLRKLSIYVTFRRQVLPITFVAMGIILHCLLRPYMHAFWRDYLLVGALVLSFSDMDMPLLGGIMTQLLSDCSMGIFLVHPFFAAGMAALASHVWTHSFGAGIVMADWIVVYFMALTATLVIRKIPKLNMFVK